MPLHQTPFDHIGLWSPSVGLVPFLQGTCFVLIEAARFAMSSLLIVLGVPLFVFLLIAGWDLTLLFAQLENLAAHYRDADVLRRLGFAQDLGGCFVFLTLGVLLLRAPRFLRHLDSSLASPRAQEADHG